MFIGNHPRAYTVDCHKQTVSRNLNWKVKSQLTDHGYGRKVGGGGGGGILTSAQKHSKVRMYLYNVHYDCDMTIPKSLFSTDYKYESLTLLSVCPSMHAKQKQQQQQQIHQVVI